MIAGLLVVMFWKFSGVMWDKWFEELSYYSHGLVIPLVSVFLIWRMRESLAKMRPEASRLGFVILLGGAFVRIFGAYANINFVTGFSFVIIVVGVVMFLFGRKITWKLLFPLLFLAWMVPLPDVTIQKISFELKNFASEVSTRLLPHLGMAVFREGSTLHFLRPDESRDWLVIGDVCSGLRSMIALLAFGSIFAYITTCSLRRKAELFAASIPCSIIANITRIVVMALVAYFWGSEIATKRRLIPNPFGENFTVHDATGILIFVVAFIGFFTYEKLLNRPGFRLPKPEGPKNWAYDRRGTLLTLAENQLECLIKAGHVAVDDSIRLKGSPQWQKADTVDKFSASPRHRKLKLRKGDDDTAHEMTFGECIHMAKSGQLGKDDFLSYSDGDLMMRAGNLDFLRAYWPASVARKACYILLYLVLPVALFFVVRQDEGLGSLANGRPGIILVTIVVWFAVRALLLLAGIAVQFLRHVERPMPAVSESGNR